jgi:PII-like signaling protein
MRIQGEGQLLRVFVGESDRWEGRPLYEAIVLSAREQGLAGATVLRGLEGFGAHSRIHTVKVLRLSEDLPIVVEIVDLPERISRFLPTLDKMVTEGLVTLEKVNVLIYRHNADVPARTTGDDEGELELESPAEPARAKNEAEFSKATNRTRDIIAMAKEEADQAHRGFVDSVDLLLAMLREPDGFAGRVLQHFDISRDTVETRLHEQVSRETPTDQFLSLLVEKSQSEASWLDHHDVGTEHLLLALCEIRPSAATDILMQLGVQPRDICRKVLEILGHEEDWQRWLADHPDM